MMDIASRNQIFDDARSKLGVDDDAKPIYFWEDCNLKLTPVDTNKLDERDKKRWLSATAIALKLPADVLDETMLIMVHKCITTNEECDLPDSPITSVVKKNTNTKSLYYEEENGTEIGMSYYDRKSLSTNSPCYDIKINDDDTVEVSRVYAYAFMIETRSHNAFIYKGRLKTLLYFQPNNLSVSTLGMPSPVTFINAKSDDPEIKDIMFAIKAKYNASVYFDAMRALMIKYHEDDGDICDDVFSQ